MASFTFQTRTTTLEVRTGIEQGKWLMQLLQKLLAGKSFDMQEVKTDYESFGLEDFELFWDNKPINQLYKTGLLII